MNLKKFNNLLELFFNQYEKQDKNNIFLSSLKSPIKEFSWEDTKTSILNLSKKFKKYIQKGDRCLLISENRPEWLITDLAIMLANGITVPAYTTYVERDYEYIINDCTPTIIIVSNKDQYLKIKNIIKDKSFIKKVFSFEAIEELKKDNYFEINNFLNKNKISDLNIPTINLSRKDPACIIYTSGTQGNPKGVILSHGGILNNCEGGCELIEPFISKQSRFLTWLPLSHSYEHTVQFIQIGVGAKVYYAESIEKLVKNMNDCSPEIMTAVPRFYQNLYQKINSTFKKATGFKKVLINQTVKLGTKKIKKENLSFIQKIHKK